ncbi:MAG: CAP domain-containing protein [Chthoniobacterales bacterium]
MQCSLPLLAFCTFSLLGVNFAKAGRTTAALEGSAVVREMNLARQHPEVYAQLLEAQREHYHGGLFARPGGIPLRTKEGLAGLNEAIRFLRRAQPVGALNLSTGISLAAADHVADQASGTLGHDGSDRSNPGARMNRHGSWGVRWGENIAYGKSTAREIVIALIIDDGLRSRKHRENIFDPAFNYAGAAVGKHARYRTVCSIDFAGGYLERVEVPKPLFAGN